MTNFSGSTNKILLLPINAVVFNDYNDNTKDFTLFELEAESSFTINQITRPDDKGAQRVLGYRVEATIYMPHNDFSDNGLPAKLAYFSGKPHVTASNDASHIHITFKLGGSGGTGPTINSVATAKSVLMCNLNGNVGLNWAVESLELRTRLKLTITAFDKSYDHFVQY